MIQEKSLIWTSLKEKLAEAKVKKNLIQNLKLLEANLSKWNLAKIWLSLSLKHNKINNKSQKRYLRMRKEMMNGKTIKLWKYSTLTCHLKILNGNNKAKLLITLLFKDWWTKEIKELKMKRTDKCLIHLYQSIKQNKFKV